MQTGKKHQTVTVLYLISHQKESAGFYLNDIFCIAQLFIFTAHILDKQKHFISYCPRELALLLLQKKPFLLLGIAVGHITEVCTLVLNIIALSVFVCKLKMRMCS